MADVMTVLLCQKAMSSLSSEQLETKAALGFPVCVCGGERGFEGSKSVTAFEMVEVGFDYLLEWNHRERRIDRGEREREEWVVL